MSRRKFVLNNARKLGLKNAERMKQLSYAVLLSDFLERNAAAPRFSDRYKMYDEVMRAEGLKGAPLQYLEFGVYKGDSIRYWAGKNAVPSSGFTGFDSFEGLPEDWFKGMEKGVFDTGGVAPDMDDSRVGFVKGWFNESLQPYLVRNRPDTARRTVIHMDADLYSSTYYVLNCLYFDGWIKSGTVLIFDEVVLASIAHTEFRAFYDFVQAMGLQYRVLGISKYEMGLVIQ